MKRIILLLFFCTILLKANSQEIKPLNLPNYDNKKYHFGFNFGLNDFNFHINPNNILIDSIRPNSTPNNYGFSVGILANYRLNNFMDLRFIPEFSTIKQSLDFSVLANGLFKNEIYSFKVSQINIPLLLKFKFKRLRNFRNSRPYFILGSMYRKEISRKQTSSTNNDIQIIDNDFCFIIGAGLDNYFPFLKFSSEIDFSIGIKNLIQNNNSAYSGSIDKLTSRIITLYLYFE